MLVNKSMVGLFWKVQYLSLDKEDGSSPISVKDEFTIKLNLLEFPIL